MFNIVDAKSAYEFLEALENGTARIVEENFELNIANKENILKVFKHLDIKNDYQFEYFARDKIPLMQKLDAKFRIVPGSIIRRGAYIGDDVVVMPSFINIGASVGEKTMIDSYATIGSCAFIGKRCHISSSTVVGGVLEPINAMPVIIEDDVVIGAGCVVAEGVRIKSGSIVAAGVTLTSSVKIIDRQTGDYYDHVPANSLVIPGSYESISEHGIKSFINCAWVTTHDNKNSKEKVMLNVNLRSSD